MAERYTFVENLPLRYRMLPEVIDLQLAGFESSKHYKLRTFAPSPINPVQWFNHFVDRVEAAIGKSFLPICRMSDGEYLFILGRQPPIPQWKLSYMTQVLRWAFAKIIPRRFLIAASWHGHQELYSSGQYLVHELPHIRAAYAKEMRSVAKNGILALDLSFCSKPFQEHYFQALKQWLKAVGINLAIDNYVPFYFVYALLTGPQRGRILKGRRVLIVHSAEGERRRNIEAALRREGVREMLWHQISKTRSLFDTIKAYEFCARVDLCIFGAGIGKPAILQQLHPLGVPCIDAGFVFETWANEELAGSRIFTKPDIVGE
jgi:hypothetical protein